MSIKSICEKKLPQTNNKSITYSICECDSGGCMQYGIEVSERSDVLCVHETIENISPSEEEVRRLIEYLSENAVDTAHFRNIVEDYIISEK